MEQFDLSHRQASIALLHSLESDKVGTFGAKTAGLVSAISSGATVLPGLALSVKLASEIAAAQNSKAYHRFIEGWLLELARAHPASNYIVRSSSIFENDQRSDFSGVFETYAGVKSAEEIALAIKKIVNGARSSKLAPYFEECGVSIECDHMAILIQPEASPEYGGVIELKDNRATIEYTSRSISAAIFGDLQYSSVSMQSGTIDGAHIQDWDRSIEIDELNRINFLEDEFWQNASRDRAIVEFFVENSAFYVAQVKDGYADILSGLDGANEVSSYRAPASAGKFAAMSFFSENNLFDKPLFTLERGWTVEAALACTKRLFNKCDQITLRVAQGVEIGLPRVFCSNVEEAHSFLREHNQSSYDLIMHGYIDVERSLEILVDHDGFVVEHIPGMWESPNAHQPDVLMARDGVITQYRINGMRVPVIEGKAPSNSDLSKPLATTDFECLVNFASKVWASFDANYRSDFPLNIHAVCDNGFDEFQCLNIRPGFKHEEYLLPVDNVRVVKGLADLEGWAPDQIVRLSLSLSRGDEGSLIPLGQKLLKAKHPVIIDFGILSHPAMILRRIGCKLVPSYKVAGCFSPTSYTFERRTLDVGLEPVDRIFSEMPVMPSSNYHVVPDREQITDTHWIGVSRLQSVSSVDSGNIDEVLRIFDAFSEGEEAFFFEKGGSDFCTSIFTTPREHFHLLKGRNFAPSIDQLVRRTEGRCYPSLKLAYQAVPLTGPYVIFGTQKQGFWLAYGRNNYEKGLLRTAFSAAERHSGRS